MPIDIYVVSWNVHGLIPETHISCLFDSLKNSLPPDIVTVGLQEMDLSVDNLLIASKTSSLTLKWTELILEALYLVFSSYNICYTLVFSKSFGSLCTIVFSSTLLSNQIIHQDIRSDTISCSWNKFTGNKGAIGVSIPINTYSANNQESSKIHNDLPVPYIVTLINAHLPSGDEKLSLRNRAYYDICTKLKCVPVHGNSFIASSDIFNSDMLIFFGDLNYRLATMHKDIHAIDHKVLLAFDQLTHQKNLEMTFSHEFHEFPIHFSPTFKYETPLSYSPRRSPSWCDRILIHCHCIKNDDYIITKDNCIKSYQYDSIPYALSVLSSDHQPVFLYASLLKISSPEEAIHKRQEYQRQIDYEENYLKRPTITISDQFRQISLSKSSSIYHLTNITNTGCVPTNFSLRNNQDLNPHISFHPNEGLLKPEKSLNISIKFDIDHYLRILNHQSIINMIFILELEQGREYFLVLDVIKDKHLLEE